MKYLLQLGLVLVSYLLVGQNNFPQDYFDKPLDIPLILSGTFGELRTNHFHSGIDIKTQGREGLNVYAAAEGYVSRIKVQAGGYGNAIYIDHPNGYTTVYAHLKTFKNELAEFVKSQQYAQQSFEVDLYPVPYQFQIERGEVIAKSGNSGRSAAPHLHFEIRETVSEHPLNPLLFGYKIADTRKPNVHKIGIASINNYNLLSTDVYFPKDISLPIMVNADNVGIEVFTTDKLNGANNNNGIYCLSVKQNGQLIYEFKMDEFSFDESKYINAHIDYPYYVYNSQKIHRGFILQGDLLSCNKFSINNGWVDLSSGEAQNITIEISDAEGNTTIKNLTLQKNQKGRQFKFKTNGNAQVNVLQSFKHENELHKINIEAGAVFCDAFLDIAEYSPSFLGLPQKQWLSKVLQISPDTEVFFVPIEVCFNLDSLQFTDVRKLVIAQKVGKKDIGYQQSEINGNHICAHSRNTGSFIVDEDWDVPTLKSAKSYTGNKLSDGSVIKYFVKDEKSGIDTYHAFIDGEWVLLQYDLKSGSLYHLIDREYQSGKHEFFIMVSDACGNIAKDAWAFEF